MATPRVQEAFVDGAGWHDLPPGKPHSFYWGICKAFDAYAMLLWSNVGIIAFFPGYQSPDEAAQAAKQELSARWPGVKPGRDDSGAAQWIAGINGGFFPALHLKGTAFQLKVWRLLLSIPVGQRITYSQLAQRLGSASSTRAVASAVAKNPICILIPCHRVVPSHGRNCGEYRWGSQLKQQLLDTEAAQQAS